MILVCTLYVRTDLAMIARALPPQGGQSASWFIPNSCGGFLFVKRFCCRKCRTSSTACGRCRELFSREHAAMCVLSKLTEHHRHILTPLHVDCMVTSLTYPSGQMDLFDWFKGVETTRQDCIDILCKVAEALCFSLLHSLPNITTERKP